MKRYNKLTPPISLLMFVLILPLQSVISLSSQTNSYQRTNVDGIHSLRTESPVKSNTDDLHNLADDDFSENTEIGLDLETKNEAVQSVTNIKTDDWSSEEQKRSTESKTEVKFDESMIEKKAEDLSLEGQNTVSESSDMSEAKTASDDDQDRSSHKKKKKKGSSQSRTQLSNSGNTRMPPKLRSLKLPEGMTLLEAHNIIASKYPGGKKLTERESHSKTLQAAYSFYNKCNRLSNFIKRKHTSNYTYE